VIIEAQHRAVFKYMQAFLSKSVLARNKGHVMMSYQSFVFCCCHLLFILLVVTCWCQLLSTTALHLLSSFWC